jgi:hypothetical protein
MLEDFPDKAETAVGQVERRRVRAELRKDK